MYVKPIKIGNVELKGNIFLAPIAGITDKSFRVICMECGADLTYTEMISAKGIYYNDSKTKKIMEKDKKEKKCAIQIFGADHQIMGIVAEKISFENDIDIIDINMGCPAPKITKNGEGSKLMQNLEKVDEITKEVVKKSRVPVTIKIRKGWDENSITAVEIAKIAEKNGIAAITVHGRTGKEMYSGTVDLDIIRGVKEAVSIPVIGNGDIIDGNSAKKMFDYTKCDGIMIGRKAIGNPWIFNDIKEYLTKGREIKKRTEKEIVKMILKHLEMVQRDKGEYIAVREMRKQIAWYIKGMPNATELRNIINRVEDINELKSKIEQLS